MNSGPVYKAMSSLVVLFLVFFKSEEQLLSQHLLKDLNSQKPINTTGVDMVLTAIVRTITVPTFLNHSGVKSEYFPPNRYPNPSSVFSRLKSILVISKIRPVLMNMARKIFLILEAYSWVKQEYFSNTDSFLKRIWIMKLTHRMQNTAAKGNPKITK